MFEQILTMTFLTTFLTASVRMAMPLVLAGLGEGLSEKADGAGLQDGDYCPGPPGRPGPRRRPPGRSSRRRRGASPPGGRRC